MHCLFNLPVVNFQDDQVQLILNLFVRLWLYIFLALEASSVRSVSMGTLNDFPDVTSDPLRSLNRNSGKRSVSVEHLYDDTHCENSPPYRRATGSEDMELMSRSLTRHSSREEERLERIEKKLRSLQQQLKEVGCNNSYSHLHKKSIGDRI